MPKNNYTIEEVAEILNNIFDDYACNFNGNDEWLSYVCEHRNNCNCSSVECWKQYLLNIDRKHDIMYQIYD